MKSAPTILSSASFFFNKGEAIYGDGEIQENLRFLAYVYYSVAAILADDEGNKSLAAEAILNMRLLTHDFGKSGFEFQKAMTASRFKRLEEAANAGDKECAYRMIAMLEFGASGMMPLDFPRALKMLTELAESGDAQAQFELSEKYGVGVICKRDYDKSKFWLQKAAENGHEEAIERLQEFEDCEQKGTLYWWFLPPKKKQHKKVIKKRRSKKK